MSMSVSGNSATCTAYNYNAAASEAAPNARTSEQGSQPAAAKTTDDVVHISDEARQAIASSTSSPASDTAPPASPVEPVYTPVQSFTLPGGGTATLSTTCDAQGILKAQVSYIDGNGTEQSIPVDRSSTLRFGEGGTVEVIPAAEGELQTETVEHLKMIGDDTPIVLEKTTHEIQGTDADEVIILLPSNTKHGVWNVDAGNGNNTVIDLSGEEVNIRTGDGNDTIVGTGGTYRVESGAGDDTINLSGSVLKVDGGEGNDVIDIEGVVAGIVAGGAGDDTITIDSNMSGAVYGGDGNDLININGSINFGGVYGDNRESSSGGSDTININGSVNDSEVRGGDGGSSIHVENAINSVIAGGSGHDSITVGSAFRSTIDGGDGDDGITVKNLLESVLLGSGGNNQINVGSSFDSEIYSNDKPSAKSKEPDANVQKKRELSEYEQSIIDAALGLRDESIPNDAAPVTTEVTTDASAPLEEVLPLLSDETRVESPTPSADNAPPRPQRRSGGYGQGAESHNRASFSRAV